MRFAERTPDFLKGSIDLFLQGSQSTKRMKPNQPIRRSHGLTRKWLFLLLGLLLARWGAICLEGAPLAAAEPSIPVLSVKIVRTYPHDSHAFTQGLEFHGGCLYESTGLKGHSTLRKVALESGRVLQSVNLSPEFFGEGLTIFHEKIYQLTWLAKTGFIYDLNSFRLAGRFHFDSEGWGLTHDEHSLILSDGTNQLQFIDPVTFQVTKTVAVYAGPEAVPNLNELEYIKGMIYANVWHSPRIARIDPSTGQVKAWLDLEKISAGEQSGPEAVLNGIAYDLKNDRLFVTGKDWGKLFQIKIEEK